MQQLNPAHQSFDNIIPVLLAASDNLENWPRSRVHAPVQFQRTGNLPSPFSQCLSGVASLFNTSDTIATVPANCLTGVKDSMSTAFRNGRQRPLKLIVEPIDRGTLNSVMAACLEALSNNDDAVLMIIDATQIYDWEVVKRLTSQLRQSPGIEELLKRKIITVSVPATHHASPSPEMVQRNGKTEFPYLFNFGVPKSQPKGVLNSGLDDKLFQLGSITFASARLLLKKISKLEAVCSNRCGLAMQNAPNKSNTLWPDINVWSLLEHRNFAHVLPKLASVSLMRPAEILQPADHQSGGFVFQENCTDCTITSEGHLVALAGCSNLKVISTNDATLIVNRESDQDVQQILQGLRKEERPEIFDNPVQRLHWGIERSIISQTSFDVLSLEIFPGEASPKRSEKIHALMWTILSGQGTATIDGIQSPVSPGSVIAIPPGTEYFCINTNGRSLLLHQTRLKGNFKWESPTVQQLQRPILQASKPRLHRNTIQPHAGHLQKTASAL